jgi:DNA invertase Pin-like site-specific DNA recombinase
MRQMAVCTDNAPAKQMIIQEFIDAEVSSTKGEKERRINELLSRLQKGDTLLVAELSRLGRNMLQTLNIINELSEKEVSLVFVRQPELSTTGSHTKLLLAIYSYFAEAERDYISMRTKQGLAAARAKGVKLGRPKGSRNKERILDPHRNEIMQFLEMGVNLAAIRKIINSKLEKPISYNSYQYFVQHDEGLRRAYTGQQ